jgi:site-specific DNA-methyltransferase (adenine-specific)/modification methylase
MPDKCVALTVTSPPYNMRTRIRDGEYTTREITEHFCKKYSHFDDALPIGVFYDFHKKVLFELIRVSNVVAYNIQIVTGSKEAFFKLIGDFNQDIKDIIIWDKGFGQPAIHEKVMNSAYEMILMLEGDKKGGRLIQHATFKRGEMQNILRINRGQRISNIHGAVFPDELPDILIKSFSNEGDLIYDPFLGSGTTAKIAKLNGRNWIGSEISSDYCKIAEQRVNEVSMGGSFYGVPKEEVPNLFIDLFGASE